VISDPAQLPDGGIVDNGAVVIEDDTIEDVGRYETLKARFPDAKEVGSNAHIVIPGLVNAHDHGRGIQAHRLGMADDYLEPWLLDFWRAHPLDTHLDTLYCAIQQLKAGITTVVHSGYWRDWSKPEQEAGDALEAYDEAGIRLSFAPLAIDQNTFVYQDDETFLDSLPDEIANNIRRALEGMNPPPGYDWADHTCALVEKYANHPRIRILFGPTGPEWCSRPLLEKSAKLAKEMGAGIHAHCLESPIQRDFFQRTYGQCGVAYLRDCGLLGPKTSLAHCTWFGDEDIAICAETETSVCHNASSNLRLRNGIAPVARMLELGVNVGIGMDSYSLNSDDDMLREMRLVENIHHMPKGGVAYEPCPSGADVFRMATLGGAKVSTFDTEIGALVAGRQADAVLIDYEALSEPYLDPRVAPHDAILRLANASHVDTVMVAGELLVAGGVYQRQDEAAIARRLAELAEQEPAEHLKRFFEAVGPARPYVAAFFEKNYGRTDVAPYYTVNSSR
jgi:cytosine/adenosine deaminase-related metal-dependent hydrolase